MIQMGSPRGLGARRAISLLLASGASQHMRPSSVRVLLPRLALSRGGIRVCFSRDPSSVEGSLIADWHNKGPRQGIL